MGPFGVLSFMKIPQSPSLDQKGPNCFPPKFFSSIAPTYGRSLLKCTKLALTKIEELILIQMHSSSPSVTCNIVEEMKLLLCICPQVHFCLTIFSIQHKNLVFLYVKTFPILSHGIRKKCNEFDCYVVIENTREYLINSNVCEDHHSQRTVERHSAGKHQIADILCKWTFPIWSWSCSSQCLI